MKTRAQINLIWVGVYSLMLLAIGVAAVKVPLVEAQLALPEIVESADVEVEDETDELESIAADSFLYQVNAGDNLTLLARRSIQLYASTQDSELSVAQVIAAETCVVQAVGAFEVWVGQQVSLGADLIKTCVETAQGLDEASQARWAKYTPINQQLEHIGPFSVPAYIQLTQTDAEEPIVVDDQTQVAEIEATATETGNSGRWVWWVIGLLAAVVAFNLFGKNNQISKRYQQLQKLNKKSKK